MIELLLVVIIALICLAIYGATYYILKVKANATDGCPICPDCNVSCPENVCPECQQCPERQECPEIQEFGFKADLSDLKKLFNSIKHVNQLTIEKYCTSADSIKAALDEKLVEMPILDDLDCKNVLNLLKSEVLIKNESEQYELSEEQQRENKIIIHTFEIAELLISREDCETDGKTNKVKVVNFIKSIIDAFCYDDYEEAADQTEEDYDSADQADQADQGSSEQDSGQQYQSLLDNLPSESIEYLSNTSVNRFCMPDEVQDCPDVEGDSGASRGGICYYKADTSCSDISKEECHIDVATYEEDPENNQKPTGKYYINDNGERVYCRWRDESNGEGGDTSSGKCEDAGMCLDDRKLIDEIRENGFENTKDDCNRLCQMCNNLYGSTSSGCISICALCQDSDYWNENMASLSQST